MQYVTYLLMGGFLKGYRTAVLAVATVLGVFAQWAVGDMTLQGVIQQDWPALVLALGIGAAAVHEPKA